MFFDRILKVENVGPGKTALVTCGLGATYDKLILLLGGGLVAADITEIRIKANDIEFFKDTGPNLNKRQAYKGISTDVGEVCIDFTEPRSKGDAAQQYLASIPANLLKKLVLEVDIAGGANAGSTLAVAAEFRGPTKNPFILKRRVFNFFAPGAADHDLFLPSGIFGGIIKRLWIHDGDHVTKAQLKVGGFTAQFFRTIAELERMQARQIPALVPQAGIVVLDFIPDGNLMGALNTADLNPTDGTQVLLQLTTDAAQAIVGYIDYIDPLDRLK